MTGLAARALFCQNCARLGAACRCCWACGAPQALPGVAARVNTGYETAAQMKNMAPATSQHANVTSTACKMQRHAPLLSDVMFPIEAHANGLLLCC